MTKIMLVEDDNNLREIYEARLLAEGYEIVSAKDGEEALALAVKEKPDLIISDVMMPKISGFDMLDILRSTPETKETKVIMMTALSQAEDKTRADELGADRYLVKSQVTLEDVAKVAREVLSGESGGETPATAAPAASTPVAPDPAPAVPDPAPAPAPEPAEPPAAPVAPVADPTPVSPTPPTDPTPTPDPAPAPPDPAPAPDPVAADPAPATAPTTDVEPIAETAAEQSATIDSQIEEFVAQVPSSEPAPDPAAEAASEPAAPAEPDTSGNLPPAAGTEEIAVKEAPPAAPAPEVSVNAADGGGSQKKVIVPINDLSTSGPDLDKLLEKEEQKDALAPAQTPAPPAESVIQPGGATVTPPTNGAPADPSAPGSTVHPSGDDPGNVAL
jgi:CheY-like chemotaxis protein